MTTGVAMIRAAAPALLLLLLCSHADADERFARIAQEIQRLVQSQQLPSIAVVVAKDGRLVWEHAAGWADRERQIPATPHTPYSLASVSKPFTATAVMTLVEKGHVALDRPANDYLADARITGRHAERATLRRVLTHTAGLPPYFRMRSAVGAPLFEETIANRAILLRRPGQRHVYSNLGYGILDHIIARVSGLSYAEFMRRKLFDPLRLARTFVADAAPDGAAVRYDGNGDPLPFYDLDHRGASSIYASAQDLARFGMLHLNRRAIASASDSDASGSILQARSIREMQRVHTWTSPGEGYGFGWRIQDDQRGFRHVGHTGGMPGVTTVLSLFPAERVVVVVLANTRSEAVVPLAHRVADVLVPWYGWQRRHGRALSR